MQRRELISLLGGAAASWSPAARAQPAGKLPTIGFLGADAAAFGPWTAAFVERLRELGWIEGRTIAIEYRWSEGRPDRYAEIAAEFVTSQVLRPRCIPVRRMTALAAFALGILMVWRAYKHMP